MSVFHLRLSSAVAYILALLGSFVAQERWHPTFAIKTNSVWLSCTGNGATGPFFPSATVIVTREGLWEWRLFKSSMAFQETILVFSEQLLVVPGILVWWDSQKHHSKSSVWYCYSIILCLVFVKNTREMICFFNFLFQVHLKELNTKLRSLVSLTRMTIIRERNIITIWHWRGSDWASLKYATLAYGLVWAEVNSGPKDSGRAVAVTVVLPPP